jgi:hypothetical protein
VLVARPAPSRHAAGQFRRGVARRVVVRLSDPQNAQWWIEAKFVSTEAPGPFADAILEVRDMN